MPTAEPGSTTTELKFLIAAVVTSALGFLAKWGFHPSQDVVDGINSLVLSTVTAAVGYALSRGIRKIGTS